MLFTHEELAAPVDVASAEALLLAEGEMSLHHIKILHGSAPNRTGERRYGFAIRYVAPHVRQLDKRDSAILVRGVDSFGHFIPDPVPQRDMDPEELAFVDRPLGASPRARAHGSRPGLALVRDSQE